MESQIQRLIDQTWKKFQQCDASKRYLIGLGGIPGSGKTTIASLVAEGLNELHHNEMHKKYPNSPKKVKGARHFSQPDMAFAIPLDGFHMTRQELAAMPNPEEAAFRRGAAFTFDVKAYLKMVLQLSRPLEANTRTLHAPSFDHLLGDPVQDDIHIPPTARILIIEGLYVTLNREGWREAAELMDEVWFVDVPIEVATPRVSKRNFAAGLSPTYEAAVERTNTSDMRNAREILDEMMPVQETIHSIEDEAWKSEDIKLAEQDDELQDRPRLLDRGRVDSIAELVEAGAGM